MAFICEMNDFAEPEMVQNCLIKLFKDVNFQKPFIDHNCYIENHIIGGRALTDGSLPWLVHLYIAHDGDTGYCTGSVLSPNYILTAKHCTAFSSLESIKISYGSANKKRMISQNSIKTFSPNSTTLGTVGEDIALIKLETPIEFNENVNPICLSRKLRPKIGDKAIVAGFGLNFQSVNNGAKGGDEVDENGMNVDFPEDLNAVKVDITEDVLCTCRCDNPEFVAFGIKNVTEMCAGGLLEGTLGGDSGGPLMILDQNSKQWFQVGITSRGQTYATNNISEVIDHGVYTDVSKFCDWIETTTNKEVICDP
uniref:Peptidase S1 domain-containing protein n=1 Tax=Panagrolaimus davidi TaxID=227884 RepID=A0A914QWY4_9BILA